MQKITVEIVANGFTGLTAENIEKALDHYFGSPTLRVSFAVTEAAQQSFSADDCESEQNDVPESHDYSGNFEPY